MGVEVSTSLADECAKLLDTPYIAGNVDYIPHPEDKNFGVPSDCLKFNAAVLFINTRCNTRVLQKNNKRTALKIHNTLLHALTELARQNNGEVIISGASGISGLYAFFTGKDQNHNTDAFNFPVTGNAASFASAGTYAALKTALQLTHLFTFRESDLYSRLKKYSALDFSIGIDYGNILCASSEAGLLYFGPCLEKPVTISNRIAPPNYIGITRLAYTLIPENLLTGLRIKKKTSWRSRFVTTTNGLETMYICRIGSR